MSESDLSLLSQYKHALDESAIVSKTDPKGIITYVNQKFCDVSGYTQEELIGHQHNIIRHPKNSPSFFQKMWSTIQNGEVWRGTFRNRAKNGEDYYVKSVIAPIFDKNKNIIEYIAIRTDITELVQKDKIIKYQYTDKLTSLQNKEALFEMLKNSKGLVTLVLINIDKFSTINDYFGYEAGDYVLKELAHFLVREIHHDSIYRISGDEFGVICQENSSTLKIKEHVLEHIQKMQEKEFSINGLKIKLDYSCGVAQAKSYDVYKLAHMALKECSHKKEKVIFYNEYDQLSQKIKDNIEMVNTVRLAMAEDRVIPYFQGIVDNKTQNIVKYEVLMRIQKEDGSILSPFFFLEHAKSSKLYEELNRIIIKKAFEVFEKRGCAFSLNLSTKDMVSKLTRELLFECMRKHEGRGKVILEIVESEGIDDFEEVNDFIQAAKERGFLFAVDDFGTGYSNFNYLVSLNVDYIKIDGSIIKNVTSDKNSQIVLQSILFFAKSMGLQTIAEFVEDEDIYELTSKWGVDFSQGYYFSKPSRDIENTCFKKS